MRSAAFQAGQVRFPSPAPMLDGTRSQGIGAYREGKGGVVSSATPGGSGPQVGGGPARAVHVERRGVMRVGDLPAHGRPAEPDGGPEPQVDLLSVRLRACHMGEAMAEGDVVTRLDDRLADVVADRAVPGPEPALDPGWVASLIPGVTQRQGQAEADDFEC